jgi:hypothetical protein
MVVSRVRKTRQGPACWRSASIAGIPGDRNGAVVKRISVMQPLEAPDQARGGPRALK